MLAIYIAEDGRNISLFPFCFFQLAEIDQAQYVNLLIQASTWRFLSVVLDSLEYNILPMATIIFILSFLRWGFLNYICSVSMAFFSLYLI